MKKKLLITAGIVLTFVLVLALVVLAALGYMTGKGYGITVGRFLTTNGGSMLIDGSGPIVMSDRSEGKDLFEGLKTGDKILVIHDGICESYPAQTGAYRCIRLEEGSISDFDSGVLNDLASLGWISYADAALGGGKSCGFNAQYIRTNGYHEGVEYPVVTVIRSTEELNAYYEANKELYSMGRRENPASDSTIGFLDACDKYDDAYFENQILVLILLEEGSGSIRHEVTDVSAADGHLVISIDSIVPEQGTCDMAEWHIFVEPEAGVDVACAEAVMVCKDGRNVTREPENVTFTWENGASAALPVLPGWEYEEQIAELSEGASHGGCCGLLFHPEGREGGILLTCYPNGFGVCGTGLEEEKLTAGGYEALAGTYDNGALWDYISLMEAPSDYVFQNRGAEDWWDEYGGEAMFIIQSVKIG